jgi:2-polyprenyl-3-methyl-5-hydroxy-6-metoxy-1,4-benzoquinol methylase
MPRRILLGIKKILPSKVLPFAVKLSRKLEIQPRLFLSDIQQVERTVEYPWVLTNMGLRGSRILDIGCCETFFPILLANLGFEVWGIDIRPCNLKHPNFKFIQGDIRTAELPQGFFDVVTLISTIEHIGLGEDGDIECIERLHKLLKDNGNILMTVPYGKAAVLAEARIYDAERVRRVCAGFEIEKIEFFKQQGGKWIQATETEVKDVIYQRNTMRCKSIACIVARKR